MATDTANNKTSVLLSSDLEMIARLPGSDYITWLAVLITECLAIVILNIITIIVFVKQRQLQRRSTYLIVHLPVVDLLVGAVSGPLLIERRIAGFCGLWEYDWNMTWSYYVKFAFMYLIFFTSLVNLVFVSMERLHATFRPFRHRVIKKWVYVVISTVIWVTTTVRESVQIVFKKLENHTLSRSPPCIFLSIQLQFLLFVSLTSLSLSKFGAVVILITMVQLEEKENSPVPPSLLHLYLYCFGCW